ncbi:MAG: AsnC family transcriptional regulator, partial [Bacteroidetes bacterium]|nr:AsnC family transcriptional regulator [Bacteroidota bacterium]
MIKKEYLDQAADIDELDEKILKLITKNARIPFLEVARECGVSGAAIHQRVQRLLNTGVIKGSEFIVSPQ